MRDDGKATQWRSIVLAPILIPIIIITPEQHEIDCFDESEFITDYEFNI
jgi:hypothetical protein